MSEYVLDQGRRNNADGFVPVPYPQKQIGWSAQRLQPSGASIYVSPGATPTPLGADTPSPDMDKVFKGLLLLAAAFILWKLITPGAKRNPGRRRRAGSKRRKYAVTTAGQGGWYWRPNRKGGARRGPFQTEAAAAASARAKGFTIS